MKKVLLTIFLSSASLAFGQNWSEMATNPSVDLKVLKDTAEDYFNTFPELKTTKGSGYKDYQRLLWYWSKRSDQAGSSLTHLNRMQNNINVLQANPQARNTNIFSNNWQSLGPTDLPTNYNGVGWVNSIFIDRSTKLPKYAGSVTGGLWKYNTSLNEWSELPVIDVVTGVIDIEESYTDPSTL
jgi:hypothetical protein